MKASVFCKSRSALVLLHVDVNTVAHFAVFYIEQPLCETSLIFFQLFSVQFLQVFRGNYKFIEPLQTFNSGFQIIIVVW